jgi:hypothetical protein
MWGWSGVNVKRIVNFFTDRLVVTSDPSPLFLINET